MKPYKLILLLLVLLFMSCSTKIEKKLNQSETVIQVTPQLAEDLKYSDLFSEIEYFPIPTDDDFLIGTIDKLLVTDSLFIIMDREISNSIYLFNKKRRNIKTRIQKQGRGPGDYMVLQDFYYDEQTERIGIHCTRRKKILHYSILGEFLSEKSVPFHALRAVPISNNYVLFCDYIINIEARKNNKIPNIILANSDRKIISSSDFFEQDRNIKVIYSSLPDFSQWDKDTLSIKPDHSNIIYYITENEIHPAYQLDFGEYTLDDRYWEKIYEDGITIKQVSEYCNNHGLCESMFLLEDQNYIFFKYRFKDKMKQVFYSKRTGKVINVNKLKNDMDGITVFHPKRLFNNKLYCTLSAEDISIAREYLLKNGLIPKDIVNNTQEFDNPIIVAFKLKDF